MTSSTPHAVRDLASRRVQHQDLAQPDYCDPPLGPCPVWCEKPAGHEWDDAWEAGPVRFHTRRRQITKYQSITVEEVEQFTSQGPTRQRDIVFDAQSPTPWDVPTARRAQRLLGQALAIAAAEPEPDNHSSPTGMR
ncbi:hypothetical protein BN1232_06256 [Mycobacterium lentiflavum]|uniref:Uncharacterized protein n=1 Tax=Mycobacterium lentiflavum TaxID=141349 RepID=A0A0E4CRG0_MYCLN|nr:MULTISPECIES: hypothetical protein [Mycobacterium simiae complex]ULP45447.1 hypothetical protein MJO58_28195 [Mycobacterium lentiflavum]CQD24550.1 hypothetical protein BN1232_06256 [Mycobacterium lentiflavum]